VLRPGETVRLRRTIEPGPLRRASRLTPQRLQRIELRAILDPVQASDGTWRAGATGQALRTVTFNRVPVGAGTNQMNSLFAALTGEEDDSRFRAIEVMAQLLGEAQRAARQQLGYKAEAVPYARLRQALLAGLGSSSWETRVRTLDSLHVCGLDAEMVAAVQSCLEHDQGVVRLMALRLLARQGSAARDLAQRMSQDDDPLVRDFAKALLSEWGAAATSSPATQRATASPRP
jgi:hypothetical protein